MSHYPVQRYLSDKIPDGFRIVKDAQEDYWFWYKPETYEMSENEFHTPEEALADLLEIIKPKPKTKFLTKTWEEKQAEAKRKRDEANKEVLRNYRIK